MVVGRDRLHRQFAQVHRNVRQEVTATMEKAAREMVADMDRLNPMPGTIKLGWTWGNAPAGALAIGQFRGHAYGRLVITVYATARTEEYPGGFPAIARWVEFGTAKRVVKKTGRRAGRITAEPYFWPVFRANRTRIRGQLSRAVTRGVKKASR